MYIVGFASVRVTFCCMSLAIFCVAMHQLFQKDLFSLKLDTSRSYVKSLATSMAPMVTGHGGSYNISAQVTTIRVT